MNLNISLCAFAATFLLSASASGATTFFGPTTPYLSFDDTPDGFLAHVSDDCVTVLEDFEDNSLDHGLVIEATDGQILGPGFGTGLEGLTDSVDGDDGSIDGVGNEAYSYFSPANTMTIHFPSAVTAAGVVWTDGDVGSTTTFEAYGPNGLLVSEGPLALADGSFQGTTGEDTFFGVHDPDGITHLVLTNVGGLGIEIDHIQFQTGECNVVPEPATLPMLAFPVFGIAGFFRRGRK